MATPKDMALLLLKKKGERSEAQTSDSDPSGPMAPDTDSASPDELDAAQDFLDAVHSKDPAGVVAAFKDLGTICDSPAAPSPMDGDEGSPE